METRAYISSFSRIEKIILLNDAEILIQHSDLSIRLSSDKLKIMGSVEVEGNLDVTGEVKAMSKTQPVGLSTHKQSGPVGPPVPNT